MTALFLFNLHEAFWDAVSHTYGHISVPTLSLSAYMQSYLDHWQIGVRR